MTEIIYGRHSVLEVLRANRRTVHKIEVAKGIKKSEVVEEILQHARNQNISIVERPRKTIDNLQIHNQGILAYSSPYPYGEIEELVDKASKKIEPITILLLDLIQNPQNMGTLLRTAEAVGVEGVVIPLRRGVEVTPAVVSASAGASEHLLIARYNLVQAINLLRKEDFWIFGLENTEHAVRIDQIDLPRSIVVIVGGEGGGIRRLSRDSCDQLLRLPMRGQVESLNAAVAGSIALYFMWYWRGFNRR